MLKLAAAVNGASVPHTDAVFCFLGLAKGEAREEGRVVLQAVASD